MRGFPKTIGSKKDMENLLAMPEHAEAAKAKLEELEVGSTVWVVGKKLTKAQPGLTSATQKVSVQVAEDGKEERYQMDLREDPQAPFFSLGLAALKQADASRVTKPGVLEEGVKDA